MSILERERVEEVVAPEEIEVRRPSREELVRHAERIIDRDGWCKGSQGTRPDYKQVCVIGAIARAGSELGDLYGGLWAPQNLPHAYFEEVVGIDAGEAWRANDSIARPHRVKKAKRLLRSFV